MQKLRFFVVDMDLGQAYDEIGYFETTIGNVMGAKNQTLTAELKHDTHSGKRGQIIIRAEAVSESNHSVIF